MWPKWEMRVGNMKPTRRRCMGLRGLPRVGLCRGYARVYAPPVRPRWRRGREGGGEGGGEGGQGWIRPLLSEARRGLLLPNSIRPLLPPASLPLVYGGRATRRAPTSAAFRFNKPHLRRFSFGALAIQAVWH